MADIKQATMQNKTQQKTNTRSARMLVKNKMYTSNMANQDNDYLI